MIDAGLHDVALNLVVDKAEAQTKHGIINYKLSEAVT